MEGAAGVATLMGAPELPEASRVSVSAMEAENDVEWKGAPVVPRVKPPYAYPMVAVAAVCTRAAPRELKAAPCFVKHMVVERDV